MTSIKSQKILFTAITSTEKMFPSYLNVGKSGSQLFRALQTLLQLFGERKMWISAIWRKKNVVHTRQEQGKRL